MNIVKRYRNIVKLAVPVAIENLISSFINFLDVFMVGKKVPNLVLGPIAISAIGVSNQIFNIYIVALFGLLSGAAIFSSQYYGVKNYKKLKEVGTILILISLMFSILVVVIVYIFKDKILGFYISDKNVVEVAKDYLNIAMYTYPLSGISFVISMQLRSQKNPKYSLYSSFLGLIVNAFFNFLFIPVIGIKGAAIATLIARIISLLFLIYIVLINKIPIIGKINNIDTELILKILKVTIPTFLHEMIWAIGYNTKISFFGKLSVVDYASLQVTLTISGIVYAFYIGISSACSVIVGNELGANNLEKAKKQARYSIEMTIIISIINFIILNMSIKYILLLMNTDKALIKIVTILILIESIVTVIKEVNLVILIGILRAGGDIIYAVIFDLLPLYLVAIPFMIVGMHVHANVYVLYLLFCLEEISKFVPVFYRYKSNKWLNNMIND